MSDSSQKHDIDLIRVAVDLARKDEVDYLVWVMDTPIPQEVLTARGLKKKLVIATTSDHLRGEYAVQGVSAIQLPGFPYSRLEKIQVTIGAGMSTGAFRTGATAVILSGRPRPEKLDTIFKVKIGEEIDQRVSYEFLKSRSGIPAQLTEVLLNLAIDIGHHGKEGYPIGSILVVGDTTAVMEKSRQIVMNPFQGYSEAEKNIMDPDVRMAIKSYATLDGAFIIREDGVVLSAGRYLYATSKDIKLPLGLGARHAAGATISRETNAIAIVVSQTSGAVRIFEGGQIIYELQSRPRMGN